MAEPERETFELGDVGECTATGSNGGGLLASAQGRCAWRGTPVEFTMWLDLPQEGDACSRAFAGGTARGRPRMGDAEHRALERHVEDAAREWWDTPESRALVARNTHALQDRGDAVQAARREEEAGLLGAIASARGDIAETERLIRELVRVRGAGWTAPGAEAAD